MLHCVRCGNGISLGATDCAACGLPIEAEERSPSRWPALSNRGRAVAGSAALAVWLPFGTIYTFWFFPVGILISFGIGWFVGKLCAQQNMRSGVFFLPLPLLSYAWFLPWLLEDKDFGQALLFIALGHATAVALAVALRSAKPSEA